MNKQEFLKSVGEVHQKMICSIAVGMIIVGLLLFVFCILGGNNQTSEIIHCRTSIATVLMVVGYLLFPYGSFEKKNENLITLASRLIWAVLCAIGVLYSVQYFLCNIPENNIGYEFSFSSLFLLCCSYIIYIITCFVKALYRLIKKALSSRIDNGIKEATSKIETINKLIAAIAALIASLTPVILAVCAIVKI